MYRQIPRNAGLMRLSLVIIARPLRTRHHSLEIRVTFTGGEGEYRLFLLPMLTTDCFFLLPLLLRLLAMPFFE